MIESGTVGLSPFLIPSEKQIIFRHSVQLFKKSADALVAAVNAASDYIEKNGSTNKDEEINLIAQQDMIRSASVLSLKNAIKQKFYDEQITGQWDKRDCCIIDDLFSDSSSLITRYDQSCSDVEAFVQSLQFMESDTFRSLQKLIEIAVTFATAFPDFQSLVLNALRSVGHALFIEVNKDTDRMDQQSAINLGFSQLSQLLDKPAQSLQLHPKTADQSPEPRA